MRRKWLIIIFAISSLLVFSYFTQKDNKKLIPLNQTVSKAVPGLPVRLVITAINVDANIQLVGVTPSGKMEVPNNAVDVGWFKLGPLPGERGSAVIAGHFNGENGEAGVFANLYKLKAGDVLSVRDNIGIATTFVVRESRIYDSGYADEVFNQSEGSHLNLITCDGVWDGIKKDYSKRLVVFTDKLMLDK